MRRALARLYSPCPLFKSVRPRQPPRVALLPAWEQGEIMSKYLLGCLSTLFISHTAGVISFPKFSGKFRLFISSQMFTNLLNIRNASALPPKQTSAPVNHRLLTETLISVSSHAIWHNPNVTQPKKGRWVGGGGTRWRLSVDYEKWHQSVRGAYVAM